jgi:hypothetical protein
MAVVSQRAIWLVMLLGCVLLAILLGAIIVIPHLIYPPLDLRGVTNAQVRIQLQQTQSQLASSARSAVLQGLAGLVVIAGAAATWWQLHINREGQITERFTKAVEQLGSQDVTVRIGDIYALERIARNSATDRDRILFLLGAFIRNHAPWHAGGAPDEPPHSTPTVDGHLPWMRVRTFIGNHAPWPAADPLSDLPHFTSTVDERRPWMRVRAADIQAAMGTLGRLPRSRDEPDISLSRVDLRSLAFVVPA